MGQGDMTDKDMWYHRLPGWVLCWFYATAVICTYDATYIVLRPDSMPGGSLGTVWKPYVPYMEVDQRYKDVDDPFVYGVSLFNYVEVFLNIVTIVLHYRCSQHTVPLAFTVTVMTFWKTAWYLYSFSELGGGGPYRQGNSLVSEFFLVVIPNGIWIVVPFAVMLALWSRLIPQRCASVNNNVKFGDGSNLKHTKHA